MDTSEPVKVSASSHPLFQSGLKSPCIQILILLVVGLSSLAFHKRRLRGTEGSTKMYFFVNLARQQSELEEYFIVLEFSSRSGLDSSMGFLLRGAGRKES